MSRRKTEAKAEPVAGSEAWFAQLEPGEGMKAWYCHPGHAAQVVILTGNKWFPGNPHVEWMNPSAMPAEYAARKDGALLKAKDLCGEWVQMI